MDSPSDAVAATDLHVAAAFRAFRVANGLKLRDVAMFLGVAPGTVHQYERGEIRIFPDTLFRAAALGGSYTHADDVLPRRPKWMRLRTYERAWAEWEAAMERHEGLWRDGVERLLGQH